MPVWGSETIFLTIELDEHSIIIQEKISVKNNNTVLSDIKD